MKSLTSTKDCTVSSGDEDVYLAWNDMKLNLIGDLIDNSTEELGTVCKDKDPLYRIMFPCKQVNMPIFSIYFSL